MRRLALPLLAPIALVLAVPAARAAACPATVTLSGDTDAVAAIATVLAGRGIAVVDDGGRGDRDGCSPVRARLDRDGATLALMIDRDDGQTVERVVDQATAATVIESFVRTDLDAPLLARIAVRPPRAASSEIDGGEVRARRSSSSRRGIELFAAAEASYADDETSWLGVQLSACISLGPLCVAARLRAAAVADGPSGWRDIDRRASELLIGLDIPRHLGRMTLSPGFAVGIGQIHTHVERAHMRRESGGLRADVHATLIIPLAGRLALDVSVAGDLAETGHVESNATVALPDDPRATARLGVGLRFGGL